MASLILTPVGVWFLCGFLAYGFFKGSTKNEYEFRRFKYTAQEEKLAWGLFWLGIIGLWRVLCVYLECRKEHWASTTLGFCLRIPENLKEKSRLGR